MKDILGDQFHSQVDNLWFQFDCNRHLTSQASVFEDTKCPKVGSRCRFRSGRVLHNRTDPSRLGAVDRTSDDRVLRWTGVFVGPLTLELERTGGPHTILQIRLVPANPWVCSTQYFLAVEGGAWLSK